MSNIINTAVIGCDMTEEFFKIAAGNKIEKFKWKKIWTSNKTIESLSKKFPEAKIVNNVEPIVDDADITLVLISSRDIRFIKPLLESGKSVSGLIN